MAASHEITHEIMRHLAVGSDAGGRYSDRIRSSNLSNPGLWLFLGIYDEPWDLYFWACTASVALQKLAESTYMICFFEL